MSTDTYLQGIDVSGHQGEIDWQKVAGAGVSFAYIKSSEGDYFTAKSYKPNRKGARDNGIVSGAYHFAQLGTDPVGNAQRFHEAMGDYGAGDLYPCLDVEGMGTPAGTSAKEKADWMVTFAQAFVQLRGLPLVLYGASSLGNDPRILPLYPFVWSAVWSSSQPQPKNWPTWSVWQYSDSGDVPGIKGPVDLDYMRPQDLDTLTIKGAARTLPILLGAAAAAALGVYLWHRPKVVSDEL